MEALRKHTNETQDLALENSTAFYAMTTSHSSQLELGFSSASVDVVEAKKIEGKQDEETGNKAYTV